MREVARAATAAGRDVVALVQSGQVASLDGGFFTESEALRAVRLLTGARTEAQRPVPIFQRPPAGPRVTTLPLAASTALHAGLVVAIALLTALGVKGAATESRTRIDPSRLIFLAIPGPGGGGGGGGVRRPDPPARAELAGKSSLRSPVRTEPRRPKVEPTPAPPPPEPRPAEKPADTPVVQPAPPVPAVPPVTAPVASVAGDERDRAGVADAPPATSSEGPGTGGGTGTGAGTGMGEGKGSGVGAGEGGGTGGGPYRPGSGINPPGLLREVKPQYTEEARRAGIEGDVLLEIVVRADGSVGQISTLQRLGYGLDQRAVEAVRQWRFSPARRFGTPVDVLVEVAVEFKLR